MPSDIHPWDILIDNQRWPGKIRLVGYIDVFFLMCYSGESRFEHGIIIYSECIYHLLKSAPLIQMYVLQTEDDEIIRQLLKKAGLKPEDKPIQLECINDKEEKEGRRDLTLLLEGSINLAPKLRLSSTKILFINYRKGW